jgi:tetratricopeptide (TPR) repeat protein
MSSLHQLFSALDGWESSYSSEGIHIAPDPAIQAAKQALSGQGDVTGALRQIQEQIPKVRKILRGIRFDVIREVHSELGTSPNKMVRLAVELHQMAALLCMRQREWQQARDHLICAVACRPDDPDPRFYFVEIYLETGLFEGAFNLLQQINDRSGELREGAFQLYHLSRDIQARGALVAARSCYEKLIQHNGTDPFADLARVQIVNIDSGRIKQPPIEELECQYRQGIDLFDKADHEGAMDCFLNVLCWLPDHANSWFIVGQIQRACADEKVDTSPSAGKSLRWITPESLESKQYQRLHKAVQAFRLATLFDPKLIAGHIELTYCYLYLNLPGAAVECAETAVSLSSNDPALWSNLGMARFVNGEPYKAEVAARQSLELDAHSPIARYLVTILGSLASNKGGSVHET